jgi:carbon monoxide dehydrogenase subunit G
MARYVVHVRTPKPPAEAFAYMADLANFAEWDPGVSGVEQVVGEGPGADAAFDVVVSAVRPITLRYRTTGYEPPTRVVVQASNWWLTSLDTITVRPDDSGSVVTYDAELTLNGLLRVADPLLGRSFRRIGDRAAAGLVEALAGERVAGPGS